MSIQFRKTIDLKPYVIPMVLILATFAVTNVLVVQAIRDYYYRLLEEQSIQYAQSYAHSITKTTQASEVINELLEDKLLSASKTMALHDGQVSEDALGELADSLGLDEIYFYNSEGEIVSSNRGQYLGWTAYPDHPVFDFLISDLSVLVEDIREDTESGNLYKYAYIKTPTGFFQIGIQAQRVEEFLSAFESQRLLHDIALTESVDTVCFLDHNLVVQGSSNPDLVGIQLEQAELVRAAQANEIYSSITSLNGREVYQVYVPVFVANAKTGTLVITQSLEKTRMVITRATALGTLTVVIVFTALFYALFTTYKQKRQLHNMAYYHGLTGLPNRSYLHAVLENHLKKSPMTKRALLLIHFRNFNAINHVFGFHSGDRVLRELGRKLQQAFQDRHELFHFSSSRFALLVDTYESREDLVHLATEIKRIAKVPLFSNDLPQQIAMQVGIVEIEDWYNDPDQIFTNASLALMHTSDDSNPYSFFNTDMETQLRREDLIERELRSSLAQPNSGTLYLEYQPIVDLKTNKIVAFEALARMSSEKLGFVSPVEFISIAERKQLIVDLGDWVLRTACQFAHKLSSAGYDNLRVAVNISVTEILQQDSFEKIRRIVEDSGVTPASLELEITESVIMYDFEEVNSTFQRLRELGVRIALDDFGTGYSSFARIEELIVDVIKIDKHFVDKIAYKGQSNSILNGLLAMSHNLGLQVVAEGVETEAQRHYLANHNCDMMQGYLYSKPLREDLAMQKLTASDL